MIVFELVCADKHRFEGWFASTGDFDQQRADGLLTCPHCGRVEIDKLPTAKIKKTNEPSEHASSQRDADMEQAVLAVLEAAFKSSEDVGIAFAEEARRIHYDEAPKRSIRGIATPKENAALREEGIEVLSLPLPRKKMN
ncbi:MAG TPA: DUF1178 family protein [Burkholderiales bacterium]|nr:DUF1178 family protein [Burkholderiales bacterium]